MFRPRTGFPTMNGLGLIGTNAGSGTLSFMIGVEGPSIDGPVASPVVHDGGRSTGGIDAELGSGDRDQYSHRAAGCGGQPVRERAGSTRRHWAENSAASAAILPSIERRHSSRIISRRRVSVASTAEGP